jgi:hypothetical protein
VDRQWDEEHGGRGKNPDDIAFEAIVLGPEEVLKALIVRYFAIP